MSVTPLVSVLMPVYNGEKYLSEAIESILNQTFHDFEFLIIDDGSTDDSNEIVQSFRDPRIRLKNNHVNQGIVRSLNNGIDLARGKFVARMDSDDISLPTRLEKQVEFLETNPDYALVCSWITVINKDKKILYVQNRENKYLYYNLIFACYIAHPTVLFKHKIIQKIGKYDIDCPAEDYALWSKLMRNYKIHKIDETLLLYRISNDSLSVRNANEIEKSGRHVTADNLSYYLGKENEVPKNFLDCYRENYEPILKEQNIKNLTSCINLLKIINKCIESKENVNRHVPWLREAGKKKIQKILTIFINKIGIIKSLRIILQTKTYDIFLLICWQYAKQKLFLSRKS